MAQPTLSLPQKLWPHQRKALNVVAGYLHEPHAGSSAMVTMPTGTGKTGVIAGAACGLVDVVGHRLVLTPWRALVTQMVEDLNGRFWTRAGIDRPATAPNARKLPPASELNAPPDEPTLFVATIAALLKALDKLGEQDLGTYFAGFGLVLVDEGHYEPAARWSEAIRTLRRPTVLLTATPYRNDRKFFNVGGHAFRFTHKEALAKHFLRDVHFQSIAAGKSRSVSERVSSLLDAINDRAVEERVIVRCGTEDEVRQVTDELSVRGESVIGIHHEFDQSAILRREVPSPDEETARFWVHQYKLLEGIDDPRFKVVALLDGRLNDRALVQQIGRVLRNPSREPDAALVLYGSDRDAPAAWARYEVFDREVEKDGADAGGTSVVARMSTAQPSVFYGDGAFRVALDLDDLALWRTIRYPLRTRIFAGAEKMDIATAASDIAAEWRSIDRSVGALQRPDANSVVLPYIAVDDSPFLRTSSFLEARFGFTSLCRVGDLLFLFDARGRVPELVSRYPEVERTALRRLIADAATVRNVSLRNTDTSRTAPATRAIGATAISDLAPELSDYSFACTTAHASTQVGDRPSYRYVGFGASRVADSMSNDHDWPAYHEWLKHLAERLTSKDGSSPVLDRYATIVSPPDDTEAVHTLLDVPLGRFVRSVDGGSETLSLTSVGGPVKASAFTVEEAAREYEGTVEWDPLRERYEVEIPDLSDRRYRHDETGQDLVAWINQHAALRVVPKSGDRVWSNGQFVQPVTPGRKRGNRELLGVLTPVERLGGITSEKGKALVKDTWAPDSVFGLFVTAVENPEAAPVELTESTAGCDFLLCTDMGTEIADFIMATPERVALVHAKAAKGSKLSASAFQEVCGQAVKNAHYLQPLANEQPPTSTWGNLWRSPHVKGTTRRLRTPDGPKSGSALWTNVRRRIVDPAVSREVWIVAGATLSKAELEKQASLKAPTRPEALQIFMLLMSTWSSVSQLGARLRIFCSP